VLAFLGLGHRRRRRRSCPACTARSDSEDERRGQRRAPAHADRRGNNSSPTEGGRTDL